MRPRLGCHPAKFPSLIILISGASRREHYIIACHDLSLTSRSGLTMIFFLFLYFKKIQFLFIFFVLN